MSSALELIKNHRFLMLSKSWCPDCHQAIRFFENYGVLPKVHVVELDKMEESAATKLEAEFTAISGRKWVPSLFFNGSFWGNEETLAELEKKGGMDTAFTDAGLK